MASKAHEVPKRFLGKRDLNGDVITPRTPLHLLPDILPVGRPRKNPLPDSRAKVDRVLHSNPTKKYAFCVVGFGDYASPYVQEAAEGFALRMVVGMMRDDNGIPRARVRHVRIKSKVEDHELRALVITCVATIQHGYAPRTSNRLVTRRRCDMDITFTMIRQEINTLEDMASRPIRDQCEALKSLANRSLR
jgi:hypothetical protein